MRNFVFPVVLAIGASAMGTAQTADPKLTHRIEAANAVLQELMATPDKGVPLDIAAKAQCIAVVPGFKKGAFLVGGEYGQGIASCRNGQTWSAPVFIQLTGASFGFQAGGQATDLVLVGTNRHSLDDLLKSKVKLGGDIAVAAGPVGRDSQAATTDRANAEFLTYSRSKGLFAGVDLNGDEVHQNAKDTAAMYGQDASFQTILSGTVPTPSAAQSFVTTANQMFQEGRAR